MRYTTVMHDIILHTDVTFEEYIFLERVRFFQQKTKWSHESRDNQADFLKISKRSLYRLIKKLKNLGLLESGIRSQLKVTEKWLKWISEGVTELSLQGDKVGTEGVTELSLQGDKVGTPYISNKDIVKRLSNKDIVVNVCQEILDYLNDRTNRIGRAKFSLTDGRLKIISERLNEFSKKEIARAINFKIEEWKDTEMEKYLTPDTLFRKSNFIKYVEQSNHSKTNVKELITDKLKNELL